MNCDYCDQNGNVYVECCSRCNVLHFIGVCRFCNGTKDKSWYDKNGGDDTNYRMIQRALEGTGGYLCGYDPRQVY